MARITTNRLITWKPILRRPEIRISRVRNPKIFSSCVAISTSLALLGCENESNEYAVTKRPHQSTSSTSNATQEAVTSRGLLGVVVIKPFVESDASGQTATSRFQRIDPKFEGFNRFNCFSLTLEHASMPSHQWLGQFEQSMGYLLAQAQRGCIEAMLNIGQAYANGVAVTVDAPERKTTYVLLEQNLQEAYRWFDQAANAGNPDAKDQMDKIRASGDPWYSWFDADHRISRADLSTFSREALLQRIKNEIAAIRYIEISYRLRHPLVEQSATPGRTVQKEHQFEVKNGPLLLLDSSLFVSLHGSQKRTETTTEPDRPAKQIASDAIQDALIRLTMFCSEIEGLLENMSHSNLEMVLRKLESTNAYHRIVLGLENDQHV